MKPSRIQQITNTLQKLEPHIKAGLSIRKSCNICGIPESSFYHFAKKYPWFLERIEVFQAYRSVLVSNIFHQRLEQLHQKFVIEGIEPTKQEWKFLQWLVLNDKSFSDQFGKTSHVEVTYKKDVSISEFLDKLEEDIKNLSV